jgi:hypothetical protein
MLSLNTALLNDICSSAVFCQLVVLPTARIAFVFNRQINNALLGIFGTVWGYHGSRD